MSGSTKKPSASPMVIPSPQRAPQNIYHSDQSSVLTLLDDDNDNSSGEENQLDNNNNNNRPNKKGNQSKEGLNLVGGYTQYYLDAEEEYEVRLLKELMRKEDDDDA